VRRLVESDRKDLELNSYTRARLLLGSPLLGQECTAINRLGWMARKHKRNTRPMLSSPRCGAKTRSGRPCRSPAVNGKKRCRMHGGAEGSGAPKGNQNALKHGRYTKAAIKRHRRAMKTIREFKRIWNKYGNHREPAKFNREAEEFLNKYET
jgi:hypothetical protein